MFEFVWRRLSLGRNRVRFRLAHSLPWVPGPRFECPVCETKCVFVDFGYPARKNVCCSNCGSLERHRGVWLYLKERTRIFEAEARVLHFAPEGFSGRLRGLSNVEYVTADLEPEKAMLTVDICDMQLDDRAFDVILCSHVLEHVENDHKAMSELLRVLKPGGVALVMVPINRDVTYEDPSITTPAGRLKAFGQPDHVRVYGPDIAERLRAAGFEVDVVRLYDAFGPERYRRHRLGESEQENTRRSMYVCRRPSS